MFPRTVRRSFATRPSYTSRQLVAPRQFQTSTRQLARKDAQDKDSLKPESNEYSKSGSDAESAAVEDAAFNPDKTSPEEQHDTAGAESGSGEVSIIMLHSLYARMNGKLTGAMYNRATRSMRAPRTMTSANREVNKKADTKGQRQNQTRPRVTERGRVEEVVGRSRAVGSLAELQHSG